MVEGLTTSAPDQAVRGKDPVFGILVNTSKSTINDFGAPRSWERAGAADHIQQQDPGDTSGEAIPVPIPNTEVKLSSAEDTERAAFRENRSSPGFCASTARVRPRGGYARRA